MRTTTVGQLLLESIVPVDIPIPKPLIKSNLIELLSQIARQYPDKYSEIVGQLSRIGSTITRRSGFSFSLEDFKQPLVAYKRKAQLNKKIQEILVNKRLTSEQKNRAISDLLDKFNADFDKDILTEAIRSNNRLAAQVVSGARGNAKQLQRLIGGDIAYLNAKGETIPLPVLNSYSTGLSFPEYWAAAYGARKGLIGTKLGVADSGYAAKLLNQITHRLMVTAIDSDQEPDLSYPRGLPVDVDDPDNIGALLAYPAGGYAVNTVLTAPILQNLANAGIEKIIVRSPSVGGPPDGGLYARDVGIIETGRLPDLGAIYGMTAAQSIGERLAQTSLSSKHSGGIRGAAGMSGFDLIMQHINVPKLFRGGATHAEVTGLVNKIEPSPVGGTYIYINGVRHFVRPKLNVMVKVGDKVEAGDILSDGIPNPAEYTRYKGIGEGRRRFIQQFRQILKNSGIPAHRRNVEAIARGLINHVEFLEPFENWLPGDVVAYSTIESKWTPRPDSIDEYIDAAEGQYLERPVLHYSIGTKLLPSMIKELKQYGIKKVIVNKNPPPFTPTLIRAQDHMQNDPNFFTRLLGANQLKSLLSGVYRGATADIYDTSYVTAKAEGSSFGTTWPNLLVQKFK